MNFKVQVNSNLEYNITSKELSEFDTIKTSDSKHHVLHNNKSYFTEIKKYDFKKKSYQVKVNNNTYNINIFNDLDLLIESMGFSISAAKHINSIKAPMPGLILEIHIEVGQEVKENDTLMIFEAMKMENSITSPRNGIIKSIVVEKGNPVDKHQLLIEFE